MEPAALSSRHSEIEERDKNSRAQSPDRTHQSSGAPREFSRTTYQEDVPRFVRRSAEEDTTQLGPVSTSPALLRLDSSSPQSSTRKTPDEYEKYQHPHRTSMGAAVRESKMLDSIPEPSTINFRRGWIPLEAPRSTDHWTTAKWAQHVNLKPFNPPTEWQLEVWFEEASPKIQTTSITVNKLIPVMMADASPTMYMTLTKLWNKLMQCTYVEDLADVLARNLFPGDQALSVIETRILQPSRQCDVRTAMLNFERRIINYQYMCERRNRHPIIGIAQKAVIFMKSIKPSLAEKLRSNLGYKRWSIEELYENALVYEDDEVGALLTPNETEDVFAAVVNVPKQPCTGCASVEHFRKDCPYKRIRCNNCKRIGHISTACRNAVFTDKGGIPRILIEKKKTGIHAQNMVDQTKPDQFKTMYGTVGTTLREQEEARGKARTRYAERRANKGKPVKPRQAPQVMMVKTVKSIDEFMNEDECLGSEGSDEEEQEESYVAYPLPEGDKRIAECKQTERAFNRNLMVVDGYINGIKIPLTLDTGASISCISEETALRVRLQTLPERSLKVRGIHAHSQPAKFTAPTQLSLNGTDSISVSFAVVKDNIPTLIGVKQLGELNVTLDPARNTISTPTQLYACYNVATTRPNATTPGTLQQEELMSVEQEVENQLRELRGDKEIKESEVAEFGKILTDFQEIWFKPLAGKCTTLQMDIHVHGRPKRMKARPVPGHLKEELHRQIQDLEDTGLIQPDPSCAWVAPVHLVPKPRSDKWRLVTDYRYVNTQMEDDGYPLPHINEILSELKDSKWFTLIDLNWGFWNVSLTESARQYTGFVIPERGVYTWKVMPFGLKISPTVFQRAIELALRPLIDSNRLRVYIDDIIIATFTVAENLETLRKLFELLRSGGFFINFKKATFLRRETLILGHIVSYNTLKPDPKKIQGIVSAVVPRTKRALKSFCAAASYLRMYVPNFSEIMEPLTRLTAKSTKFLWTQDQQVAFELVKSAMVNAVYLAMPDFSKRFIIYADASEVAVGAVLTQPGKAEGEIDYIAYASKKLTSTQRRWSTSERELYAIIWACEHFETYIKGGRPLIFTDHAALKHLVTAEQPKLRRWAIRLQEFRPEIVHVAGEDNTIADWLSRSLPEEDDLVPDYAYIPQVYHLVHESMELFQLPSPEEMQSAAKEEEESLPKGTLDWYNGVAYGRVSRRMYIPIPYRYQLLLWFHASRYGGHQGVTRTTNRMRKFVWWPNLQQAVVEFINSCPICNAIKPLKSTGGQPKVLERPQLFQLISIDYIGPRKFEGEKYFILVIVDHYSRYMAAAADKEQTAAAAIKSLELHWISKFGAPSAILADRGAQFTAQQFKEYVKSTLQSRLYFTSTEYPQGNGINESSHRILEVALKTTPMSRLRGIDTVLAEAVLLYNVTPNRMIGDTPASLTFGTDLHVPGLQDFEPTLSEAARLQALRDFRGSRMLLRQLNELEEIPKDEGNQKACKLSVGDIVTYRLSTAERKHAYHLTREMKYTASRSFPQRVVKVNPKTVVMVPLWTKGCQRQAPIEEVKLITTFIPELMREEVRRLYPGVPWLPIAAIKEQYEYAEEEFPEKGGRSAGAPIPLLLPTDQIVCADRSKRPRIQHVVHADT